MGLVKAFDIINITQSGKTHQQLHKRQLVRYSVQRLVMTSRNMRTCGDGQYRMLGSLGQNATQSSAGQPYTLYSPDTHQEHVCQTN